MTLITRTSDSATSTPYFVSGYEASYEDRNIVHDLIGGGLAITQVEQRLRAGTLHLYYLDLTDAVTAIALHIGTDTFTLADTDVAYVNMTYVPGTISPALWVQETQAWLIDVTYQEIEP